MEGDYARPKSTLEREWGKDREREKETEMTKRGGEVGT